MIVLVWLLVAHCVCDYPLQGDFLAKAKNHTAPIPGVPWYQALAAHALIHGGAVLLITGSIELGLLETVWHFVIDYQKSDGQYGTGHRAYNLDQALHVACKVVWTITFLWYL